MPQGDPLPPDFPYQGEWLVEPLVFMYRSDAQSVTGDGPRFTVYVNDNGRFSLGFDVSQIAAAFGVEIADIFAANQTGSITVLGKNDGTHFHGTPAIRYILRLGDKQKAFIVEEPRGSGLA